MASLSPLQRVLTSLSHQEPDRVPFFLLLTMHGAKELGLSIRDYFSRADHVVEGQLRLQRKFGHDCIYSFFHAPLEVQAWGGEVLFCEDGPPNSGLPPLKNNQALLNLQAPDPLACHCLQPVLEAQRRLKEAVGDQLPIIGVVMSPFSLPVMQLGFDQYLNMEPFVF
jgi:uroporphyrinogen decarboxylase